MKIIASLKNIFNCLLIILLLLIIYTGIVDYSFYNMILDILKIWLHNVMPPILVFYITFSFLIKSDFLKYIVLIFSPLNKILKFESTYSFGLYILGVFIGNPGFSLILSDQYKKHNISYYDYSRLLKCCSFQTPLFIFSIFLNLKISLIIYFSNIISSIIIAILTKKKGQFIFKNSICTIKLSFSEIFNNAISIVFSIACIMVFFSTIIYSLKMLNISVYFFIPLELNNGIIILKKSPLPDMIKIIGISGLLSFNSFSVHMQIYCNVYNYKYSSFLFYRIISCFLSIIICFILIYIW